MSAYPSNQENIFSLCEEEIYKQYGDRVSFKLKGKSLFKYGRTNDADSGSETTIMEQAAATVNQETYVSSNIIDSLSTEDTNASGTVRLEGHTLSGNKLTFVTQNVTLDGQNEVTLDTPLARATRLRKNTDASIADGNRVYVYDNTGVTLASGVPDTPANVKIVMDSTDGTSFKAATAVSNRDYWMIKKVYADVNRAGATARCDIKLKVRQVGGDFITQFQRSFDTDAGNLDFMIDPYVIVPQNSDVILTVTTDREDTVVTGGFMGWLASVYEDN